MIEEKIKELIENEIEQSKLEKVFNDAYRIQTEAQRSFLQKREENFQKRGELGRLMFPLGKNIIVNVNGKTYCVSCSKKTGVAFISEAITPKEADTKLAINKMQNGNGNQRDGTPI